MWASPFFIFNAPVSGSTTEIVHVEILIYMNHENLYNIYHHIHVHLISTKYHQLCIWTYATKHQGTNKENNLYIYEICKKKGGPMARYEWVVGTFQNFLEC